MNQDEEHLRLLSIFHYVCGGMIALFACLPIIHLIIGLVMLVNPGSFGPRDQPPAFVGWILVGVASAAILLGWTLAAAIVGSGRCLRNRVHYTYCLVVAAIACAFMPFGTVLGVFTIIVLMRPSVKAIFGTGAQPPVAA